MSLHLHVVCCCCQLKFPHSGIINVVSYLKVSCAIIIYNIKGVNKDASVVTMQYNIQDIIVNLHSALAYIVVLLYFSLRIFIRNSILHRGFATVTKIKRVKGSTGVQCWINLNSGLRLSQFRRKTWFILKLETSNCPLASFTKTTFSI